jgi:hypothetical protein
MFNFSAGKLPFARQRIAGFSLGNYNSAILFQYCGGDPYDFFHFGIPIFSKNVFRWISLGSPIVNANQPLDTKSNLCKRIFALHIISRTKKGVLDGPDDKRREAAFNLKVDQLSMVEEPFI